MINTYCNYHLGDNIVHLHYLRKVAQANPNLPFVHAMSTPYLVQLREVVSDIPNIKLIGLDEREIPGSHDAWKNRDGQFYANPLRDDWVNFHLEFYDKLSNDLGLKTPFTKASDFLFDYPALAEDDLEIDFLIVNSQPLSSQFPAYADAPFLELIRLCGERGMSVMTTKETKIAPSTHPRTITGIGRIRAKYIFGIANGPMWPTWNIYRAPEFRVVLSEREFIDIAPNIDHAKSIESGIGVLYERGIL